MESNKSIEGRNLNQSQDEESIHPDELANLKKITDIDNKISKDYGDLVVSNASENDVKEVAELWANLASVQQIFAPGRFSFSSEGKDWQMFVRKKLSKLNNLLLVIRKKNEYEVRGFLYLQTITLPSSDLVLKAIVEDVYTKPQYRRQHLANTMLDVAFEWAQNHNIKKIELISISNSKDLESFYSKILKRVTKSLELEFLKI